MLCDIKDKILINIFFIEPKKEEDRILINVLGRCSEKDATLVDHFEDTFENQLVSNISLNEFLMLWRTKLFKI